MHADNFIKDSLSDVVLCAKTMPEGTALTGLWGVASVLLLGNALAAAASGCLDDVAISSLGAVMFYCGGRKQYGSIRKSKIDLLPS